VSSIGKVNVENNSDLSMSTLSLAMLLRQAIKAGYAPKNRRTNGAENLRKPQIQAELKRRNDELQSQKTMDMREVMERLASFGRGEVTEEQVTNSGEIVQVKTKNSDQIRALELIGKALWCMD
jgi:phage terminase small subunit